MTGYQEPYSIAPPLTAKNKAYVLQSLETLKSFVLQLPDATPCHLCDHFEPAPKTSGPTRTWCAVWKAVVPEDKRDAGCDRFSEEIPF